MWIEYRKGHRHYFYKRFKTSWHIGQDGWGGGDMWSTMKMWWSQFHSATQNWAARLSVLVSGRWESPEPDALRATVVSCCRLRGRRSTTLDKNTAAEAPLHTGTAAKPVQTCSLFDTTVVSLVEEQKEVFWEVLEYTGPCYKMSKELVCAGLKEKKSLWRWTFEKRKRPADESASEQTSTIKKAAVQN